MFVTRLAADVPPLLRSTNVPALSLALVKDARIVWSGAFGVRHAGTSELASADTMFEAGSLSKPVFACAVMKLVEKGVLDLDVPRPLSHRSAGPEAR